MFGFQCSQTETLIKHTAAQRHRDGELIRGYVDPNDAAACRGELGVGIGVATTFGEKFYAVGDDAKQFLQFTAGFPRDVKRSEDATRLVSRV